MPRSEAPRNDRRESKPVYIIIKESQMIEEKTFLSMAKQLGCKPVKVRPGSELSVKLMCSEEDFLKFAGKGE